ncbi:MAG: signal peptidase I [Candidatus Dormibacteria bacterium]
MSRRQLVEVLVGAVVLFLAFNIVFLVARVSGPSMAETLRDGDVLVALRIGSPHRGDVVIFHPDSGTESDFVKRVIAVPGDVIQVKGAVVMIDGQALDEPYLHEAWTVLPSYHDGTLVTIPEGNYFLLGDNRNHSNDSRVLGLQPRDRIQAVVAFRVWPLDAVGPVSRQSQLK